MDLSVIICTHNPRADYLREVLHRLKVQTYPHDRWELLLVDNASDDILSQIYDISWHLGGRHIREGKLGNINARLCGISESKGELLILVDDDNLLEPEYLFRAQKIAHGFPNLGAWGGSITAEFETQPSPSASAFVSSLALREISCAKWSNFDMDVPVGAGLCVRHKVAALYWQEVQRNPIRMALGRRGDNLMGGEDLDLAMTAYDLGFGTGVFPELRLTHLIPTQRVQEEYLYRLCKAGSLAHHLAWYVHTGDSPQTSSRERRVFSAMMRLIGKRPSKHQRALEEGRNDAIELIARLKDGQSIARLE